MIQYILEVIAFQLVFLVVYDFFLKKETFFQWNRAYLLGTYILSLILPWIKLEMLRVTVPQEYAYPEFLWNLDNAIKFNAVEKGSWLSNLGVEYVVFFMGILLATLVFGYKLLKIWQLRSKGEVMFFPKFTRIIIANSALAFSFFKSIFLGDELLKKDHENIIQHELVHIEQRHSLDLIFFEIMRIIGWFNPLVYVYQNRISELHEYIADAKVAKTHKKEQYQLLLSQVFQTENISFVNQFFKSSLIKKRIAMLQKSRSKKIWKLKYLFLIPVIAGMLIYTSCQPESKVNIVESVIVGDIENLTKTEEDEVFGLLKKFSESSADWHLYVRDVNTVIKFVHTDDASFVTGPKGEMIRAKLIIDSGSETSLNNLNSNEHKFQLKTKKNVLKAFSEFIAEQNGSMGVLPNHFHEDNDLNRLIDNYNRLILERQRLLEKSNIESSVIKNLEQQLIGLEREINERVQYAIAQQMGNILNGVSIPFALVEQAPIFPGCEGIEDARSCFNEKIFRHIQKHFNYPKEARAAEIQGRVNIMFTIDKKGNITNIRMRGPHELLEAEAERIIERLPKMKPGLQKGKPVNVPFSIPITFKL